MTKYYTMMLLALGVSLVISCGGGSNEAALLWAEDFDDGESCFDAGEVPFSDLGIVNGELVLELTSSYRIYSSTCEELLLTDFALEMDVYDASEGDGFHFFGLLFRMEPVDGDENYVVRFGLEKGQPTSACVALFQGNLFLPVSEGKPSPSNANDIPCWLEMAESLEPGQWHHVELTANGSIISYSINDRPVGSVEDDRLTQGTIALLIGAHDAEVARFKVDNIRIRALE